MAQFFRVDTSEGVFITERPSIITEKHSTAQVVPLSQGDVSFIKAYDPQFFTCEHAQQNCDLQTDSAPS
jgi:hypothetical protein